MYAHTNSMVLIIPNLTQNVSLARVAVAAFASQLHFSLSEIEELKVAVSEAVTNAVLHAYDGPGEIRVEATCHDGFIEVCVSDCGKGISDLAEAMQPSHTTIPERMGLGFSFLESLTDSLEVESHAGRGTSIRFTKRALTARTEDSRP
jgi:stage II sporulation protein AB (anti-sigma F factor)